MDSQPNQGAAAGMSPKDYLKKLEDTLELYLVKKAPALPVSVKEFLVKYGPYILIVLLVLAVPPILLALGIGSALMPFAMMNGYGLSAFSVVAIALSVVALGLEAFAIPGLLKKSMQGWHLMFYSTLVSAVGSLINMDLFGLVLGTLISMYFLFQIKSYYK